MEMLININFKNRRRRIASQSGALIHLPFIFYYFLFPVSCSLFTARASATAWAAFVTCFATVERINKAFMAAFNFVFNLVSNTFVIVFLAAVDNLFHFAVKVSKRFFVFSAFAFCFALAIFSARAGSAALKLLYSATRLSFLAFAQADSAQIIFNTHTI